ncbi:MAG: bifunctional diaminohydroxyphosphoribosylaminopyrimidine deaminase/5-amino-6-(5-phosphoribosylamino)uracil reductase RibD [Bacteroidetes bacterium]|nr:bifunctional diaminohydroxyphosphoribosylaminopyrimidine deaminase/5-amino-6-(5-phosphoribosylamino)uracil reductase RibD [Bacteroidota bacterium]
MRRVIGLAKQGLGRVSPNPLVGCVIYKDGVKIGEGLHEKFGGPHAEVNAIGSVTNPADLAGSELFVNLEPCCHFGKTPPCTNLIIQSGIKRVVISNLDPFEKVSGNGVKQLREAGIEVIIGVMETEGAELNRPFFFSQKNKLPFVTVKIAQTADGRISTVSGQSKWITGESSRKDVQNLRFASDAVLTGSGTAKADNPSLTVRLDGNDKQPFRILLDSHLSVPAESNLFTDSFSSKTIVFHSDQITGPCGPKSSFLPVSEAENGLNLHQILEICFKKGIHQILVEAGPGVVTSLLKSGLVNQLVIYQAGKLLGNGKSWFENPDILQTVSDGIQLKLDSVEMIQNDLKISYLLKD